LGAAFLNPLRARLQNLCGGIALVGCIMAHPRLPEHEWPSAPEGARNIHALRLIIAALAHTIPVQPYRATRI
jgi:hypothetical protein